MSEGWFLLRPIAKSGEPKRFVANSIVLRLSCPSPLSGVLSFHQTFKHVNIAQPGSKCMPRLRSLGALSLWVALFCCCGDVGPLSAQTNTTPEKESETIRGTILNSVTHAPVGRALVQSPDGRFATLTDSAGHFEFRIPSSEAGRRSEGPIPAPGATSPGEETNYPDFLMARKPGYLSNENPMGTQIIPGQKEVTLYLVPGALIVGHVVVAGSGTTERVQVEIYHREIEDGRARWKSKGTFRTWSDGVFRFSELPPGTYKLITHELIDRDPLTYNPQGQLYGYSPVYFAGADNFAAGTTIQLSAGDAFEGDFSLKRTEYYPVEVGLTNAPEGARVRVVVDAGGEGGPGYALGYNPQTHKIHGFLPDGAYTVKVSTVGPASETGTAYIGVKGAPVTGYAVTLVPSATISVNLTEEFTSAEGTGGGAQSGSFAGFQTWRGRYFTAWLESANEFEQEGSPSLRRPSGPEDESLEIENVNPGRYWVRVDSARGYAASLKCGETDLLHQPLVVPAGGSTAPIELTLRDDGAQIDGIIEDVPRVSGPSPTTAFQAPPHLYLIPSHNSTGQFMEAMASPDGSFSLEQIPPADYQVLALDGAQPELEYRNEEAMQKYHSWGQAVRLGPGQRLQLRLRMVTGSD